MKQVLQSLKNGETLIVDIPHPQLRPGQLLIQTSKSLISTGTEKMLLSFGKGSFLRKIRQQPDKVKMVFDKIKSEGLISTIQAVRDKLDTLLPMGYCNVGTVVDKSHDVEGFEIGDRVVSNGAHAEYVCVPKNLCCKIPSSVEDDEAVFAVLGAIALQGIRLANPTLGESFAVMGLGLIGILTVQLLKAIGCRVLAIDINEERVKFAEQFGADAYKATDNDSLLQYAEIFSRYRGVDGVLITASTKSDDLIQQAASISRKRGRIVLVGVAGLHLSRADFYEKELTFQVSCSYGPGRYDKNYEEKGIDYPIGFVRWTEQRNFEAFLDMLSMRKVQVNELITHRFSIQEGEKAYALLDSNTSSLGIVLEYSKKEYQAIHQLTINQIRNKNSKIKIGFIGAGNYASRILIPAFKKTNAQLKTVACLGGISGVQVAKKFHLSQATTDIKTILHDQDINTVVIATRHDNHAQLVCEALKNEKNVFVEKPLCITNDELKLITETLQSNHHLLMIGFNRRFAPHIQKMKQLLLHQHAPKSIIVTVNAGAIAANHWTQEHDIGGGRIIGEACHFVDLCRYLAASPIVDYHIMRMGGTVLNDDKVSISLSFEDGSFAVIHYLANGHRSFPKERIEVFTDGKILQLDNFRKLHGFGWSHFKRMHLWKPDKGQSACVKHFIRALTMNLPAPIPLDEIIEVSRVTIALANK